MATGLCPHRFSHLHSTPHCRASHPSRLRLRARYWRMANITSATQDGARFTKPADWALHMVTASLKFSCSNDAPVSYTTPDAGRLGVLNVLNWHEAHDDYEWPDFIQLGHDFTQAMRFRRGLVNDVFLALEKAGVIKITGEPGVLGTPQSSAVKRRAGVSVAIRMSERKRHCSRESSSNEIASDKEIPYYETDRFLAKSMRCLIEYAGFPVDDCIADLEEGDHLSEEDLADTIKDLVAQVWNAEDDPRSMKRVGNIAFSKSGSEQAPRISSPEL